MIPDLQIAAIAAGSAILGSAVAQVGPVIQDWLQAKRARRILLRERFEELANLTGDLPRLLIQATAHHSKAGGGSRSTAPEEWLVAVARLHVICLVYFPAFEEQSEKLRKCSIRNTEAIRAGDTEAALAGSAEFADARKSLMEMIRRDAKRHT